ncbi:MAG: hypothetical protein HYT87_00400 [Nitrospirae bacterium]|nr:hypothetical protein [Nitrospirota bacterium]
MNRTGSHDHAMARSRSFGLTGSRAHGLTCILLFTVHCSLFTSSCAWSRKSTRDGSGPAAESSPEPAAPRRALVVDFEADPREREAVLASLKSIQGLQIEEIKSSSLSDRTLLYFKPDSKDDAGRLMARTKGAMAIDSMPWGGPYDMVVFLRSKGSAAAKPDIPPPAPKPAPPSSEVVYYVTAQKYFRIAQHQATPEGTVTLTIEKSGDSQKCFPKVTLRAMTEDRQVVSEDTIKAESFLTALVGYREDLKLSYPPEPRVKNLQIEIKAYDEKGSIILN